MGLTKKFFCFMLTASSVLLTSCSSNQEQKKQRYFDGKEYKSLTELEVDLYKNCFQPSSIYKGYYEIKSEMIREGFVASFGENESIRNILYKEGTHFTDYMSTTQHLIFQDISELLDAAGAFEHNKFAAYNTWNEEEEYGAPIYFGHTWWRYDNWKYDDNGEFGWEVSSVGKRIKTAMYPYSNNDDYTLYPEFYVTRNTVNKKVFEGESYCFVHVYRKSTQQSAYRKFQFFLNTKQIQKIKDMSSEEKTAEIKNSNYIRVG